MYRAIENFTDLQDGKYKYSVGDVFPRAGLEVSEARLEELSGISNKRGRPVIVYEPGEIAEAEPEASGEKPDFTGMTKADLLKYAKENNIDVGSAKTRKDLLEVLNA